MRINCFRPAAGSSPALSNDDNSAPRPLQRPVSSGLQRAKTSRRLGRNGSDSSHASSCSTTSSNESIARLPPCKQAPDSKIEAMMMPVPTDSRPSRCLRLSHPRIYSALVSDMKVSKGCRDWRNFAVFENDDIDMNVSAEERAKARALDYQRKLKQLNASFGSEDYSEGVFVDMIG